MLILRWSLAVLAVGLLARHPRSTLATALLALLAAVDLAGGAEAASVLGTVAPLVLFLGAALTLAGLVERSGLASRSADALAARAGGSTVRLYVLVCLACAALTATVSLDGAVVLMVPLVLALGARTAAPVRALLLAVVAVANAASIAVPQGNPTNLVLIARLGLSPAAFTAHMLLPGVVAAVLGALVVGLLERRSLRGRYTVAGAPRTALSAAERRAAVSLVAAALAAWVAPFAGIAPWWPFSGVVALALLAPGARPRVVVPWRIAAQVAALVIVVGALPLGVPAAPAGAAGLLAVAAALGIAAAVLNNLPASVWAGALLASRSGYAASVGLAVGALATPQGSVATLIAGDLAGGSAPPLRTRVLAPVAIPALAAAALLVAGGL
jgi:arsenical pump membrane protein